MLASIFSLIKYLTDPKKAESLLKEYRFVQILCTLVLLYSTIVWLLEFTVDNKQWRESSSVNFHFSFLSSKNKDRKVYNKFHRGCYSIYVHVLCLDIKIIKYSNKELFKFEALL